MRFAQSEFVFGANHAFGKFTADFTLFDLKAVIALVKRSANGGYQNFLTGSHIGCATNNRKRFISTYINFGKAQFIGVGMLFAAQNHSGYDALKAAFYRFKRNDFLNFEAC